MHPADDRPSRNWSIPNTTGLTHEARDGTLNGGKFTRASSLTPPAVPLLLEAQVGPGITVAALAVAMQVWMANEPPDHLREVIAAVSPSSPPPSRSWG